ncbi:MAG: hypothetical protein MZW92_72615 [Comamonadaceae bacterium]|nr:hypothetical protein [Comamonadaceae bacterium]
MNRKPGRFLIITGLSGSGKSVANRFLEDLGFFCVDNLPAKLIPSFVDLRRRKMDALDRVALVVDMRGARIPDRSSPGMGKDPPHARRACLFFDASDETIVQRFSESRRPHPLVPGAGRSWTASGWSAGAWPPIKALADEVINTSDYDDRPSPRRPGPAVPARAGDRPLQIRDRELRLQTRPARWTPTWSSTPASCPTRSTSERLRDGRGTQTAPVRGFRPAARPRPRPSSAEADPVPELPASRGSRPKGKSQLVVAVGCTGGRHRSVVVAEASRGYPSGRGNMI